MHEELVRALENRIELGEDKEALRAEVSEAGHGDVVFESAYREAQLRVMERTAEHEVQHESESEQEELVTTEDPVVSTSQQTLSSAHTTQASASHTLRVEHGAVVGVWDMLTQGWQVALATKWHVAKAVLTFCVLMLCIGLVVSVVMGGGMGMLSRSATQLSGALLIIVCTLALYGLAIFGGFAVRVMLIRSILHRRLGGSFWSHRAWAVAHTLGVLLLTFYILVLWGAGAVLLIVPGLVVLVYISQATKVYISEKRSGFDALIRSVELVHGRFWSVAARIAILFSGLYVIPAGVYRFHEFLSPLQLCLLLPFVLVLMYWFLCASIVLFESLQHITPGDTLSAESRKSIKFWLRLVIIAGVLFMLHSLWMSMSITKPVFEQFYDMAQMPAPSIDIERPTLPSVPTVPEMRDATEEDVIAPSKDEANTSAIKQNLTTVRSQAELYWSENLSYAGVCADPLGAYDLVSRTYDIGVGDVHCADERGWYLVEAELPDGSYFCVDSTATTQVVAASRKGEETCF